MSSRYIGVFYDPITLEPRKIVNPDHDADLVRHYEIGLELLLIERGACPEMMTISHCSVAETIARQRLGTDRRILATAAADSRSDARSRTPK